MTDMKAVVLCAGEGTRLRPLTFSRPKHLLSVGGRPLLGRVLQTIRETGITEVALVVGHAPEAVQRYVGTGEKWDMEVSYIRQTHPLGLAHAVDCAHEFVDESRFLVFLGDNLLEAGIEDFVSDFCKSAPDASLLLKEVDNPQRYGVAELDEHGRVQHLVEKPDNPATNLAIVGVYAFAPSIFDAIDAIEPSGRGEYEITDAIQHLIEAGDRVEARILEGFWEDAGEPEALLRANRLYLQRQAHSPQPAADGAIINGRPVHIGAETVMDNVTIHAPCYIGDRCVLENCEIGPDVTLLNGCQVSESSIKNTIIERNSVVHNLASGMVNSILGEDVVIHGSGEGNSPLHLILGDMAQMRVTEA